MQKNNKKGFFFFDLLVSLMIVMVFITITFFAVSLLTYFYMTSKQFLLAESIMSELVYGIEQGNPISSNEIIKNGGFDFKTTIEPEEISHTPFFGNTKMSLFLVTISWLNPRGSEEMMSLKTLRKGISEN